MTSQKSREGSFNKEQEENERKLLIGFGIRDFKESVNEALRQRKVQKVEEEIRGRKEKTDAKSECERSMEVECTRD